MFQPDLIYLFNYIFRIMGNKKTTPAITNGITATRYTSGKHW